MATKDYAIKKSNWETPHNHYVVMNQWVLNTVKKEYVMRYSLLGASGLMYSQIRRFTALLRSASYHSGQSFLVISCTLTSLESDMVRSVWSRF